MTLTLPTRHPRRHASSPHATGGCAAPRQRGAAPDTCTRPAPASASRRPCTAPRWGSCPRGRAAVAEPAPPQWGQVDPRARSVPAPSNRSGHLVAAEAQSDSRGGGRGLPAGPRPAVAAPSQGPGGRLSECAVCRPSAAPPSRASNPAAATPAVLATQGPVVGNAGGRAVCEAGGAQPRGRPVGFEGLSTVRAGREAASRHSSLL